MAVCRDRSSTRRVRAGVLVHWPRAANILVVAVEKAAKEVWWLVNTSYFSRNSNSRCSNSGTVSGAAAFKNPLTEATSCRASELVDTVSDPCALPWEALYDTLNIFVQAVSRLACTIQGAYSAPAALAQMRTASGQYRASSYRLVLSNYRPKLSDNTDYGHSYCKPHYSIIWNSVSGVR